MLCDLTHILVTVWIGYVKQVLETSCWP